MTDHLPTWDFGPQIIYFHPACPSHRALSTFGVTRGGGFTVAKQKFFCVEQVFQYAKLRAFDRTDAADKVLAATSAAQCRQIARDAIWLTPAQREEWDARSEAYMRHAVRARMEQDATAQAHLLSTGDATLVERSAIRGQFSGAATRWGVRARDGLGANLLGVILMDVRGELRAAQQSTTGTQHDAAADERRRRRREEARKKDDRREDVRKKDDRRRITDVDARPTTYKRRRTNGTAAAK